MSDFYAHAIHRGEACEVDSRPEQVTQSLELLGIESDAVFEDASRILERMSGA